MARDTFIQAVQEMRDAQKKYFQDRKSTDLQRAKRTEALVDSILKDINVPKFDLQEGK